MTISHRQIFRASAIIGAASVIKVGIGVASTKVIALLLGPSGIGLLGLFQNILQVAATLAGFGLANSSVRGIAANQEDAKTIWLIRKALFLANLILGTGGALILWMFRYQLAEWVLGDTEHAVQVGYLGVGILLTLLATSQTSVLQGLRRLGDLARVQILAAFAGAITGVAAIWLWRDAGLILFLLAVPACSILIASWYVKKLPKVVDRLDWEKLRAQWLALFSLGIPMMMAGLLTLVVQLIARSWVTHDLGLEAAGYFQAAWLISMSYLGFVLNAMGTDYYPRLTSVIDDKPRASVLVNEQTEMLLLMTAPILVLMMVASPWVIEILYSKEFAPATEILKWQLLGDVVKVITWPMGFVVLARGRGLLFIATQLNWNIWYLLILWIGMPILRREVLGIAFFVAYLAQLLIVFMAAKNLIVFKARTSNLYSAIILFFLMAYLFMASAHEDITTSIVEGMVVIIVFIYSLRRLNSILAITDYINSHNPFRKK